MSDRRERLQFALLAAAYLAVGVLLARWLGPAPTEREQFILGLVVVGWPVMIALWLLILVLLGLGALVQA